MSASQRNKGATYERAVANYLTAEGHPTQRRIDNAHDEDDLISSVSWASFECKNHKEMGLAGWVDQAVRQAGKKLGVVVHKRKGKPDVGDHYVTMRMADFIQVLNGVDRLEHYARECKAEHGSVRRSDGAPQPDVGGDARHDRPGIDDPFAEGN